MNTQQPHHTYTERAESSFLHGFNQTRQDGMDGTTAAVLIVLMVAALLIFTRRRKT